MGGSYLRNEEWKKKMAISVSENAKINSNFGMKGKRHSDESKNKMRLSKLGKHHGEEAKQKIRENAINNPHFGMKGKHFSEEHRKKISEANRGKKRSEEVRNKISEAGKGRHHSEETKKKMSNWHKGKIVSFETKKRISESKSGERNVWFGKHHTEEQKRKMSLAKMGHTLSEESRKKISEHRKGKCCGLNNCNYGRNFSEEHRKRISLARLKQVFPLKDSSIEVKIQQSLDTLHIPFEKHKTIIGQPDIFLNPNICIFADGCWWHGCKKCFSESKLSKFAYIKKNYVHDKKITEHLEKTSYLVLRFWEHEINKDIEGCIQQIQSVILWRFLEKEVKTSESTYAVNSLCLVSNVQKTIEVSAN